MSFKTTFTLSEVYNKQLSGIWPTAFYDYFEKTSLLIGTNETTFITDASTNKWALTPAAVRANNEHPYQPGYYSTYFNGSTDHLTVANNISLNLTDGSPDWTMEVWAYCTTLTTGAQHILCKDGRSGSSYSQYALSITSTGVIQGTLGTGGGASGSDSNTSYGTAVISLNTWTHIAFVNKAGTISLYVNGILNYRGAIRVMRAAADPLFIGYQSGQPVNMRFNGFISALRIVKGVAVYTAEFVPSTTPLTAVPGTSILTCMDSYHAERIIPNSITIVGVPSTRSFTPFSSTIPSAYSSYGSANINNASLNNTAFTGASFGTSADFTIESWMKWGATAAGNQTSYEFNGTTRTIIGRSSTGLRFHLNGTEKGFSYTFIPNVWYHIAIVRSLLTYYVYINGVLATTAFTQAVNHNSTTLTIGRNYDAGEIAVGLSLSNFRVVNGTAVYDGNFIPPTAPLTAIRDTTLLTFQNDKEIANSTFYDESSMKNLLTAAGTPTQGTFSPISANGWSGNFNGSTDNLSILQTTSTDLETNDFTLEMWIYFSGAVTSPYNIIGKWNSGTQWILQWRNAGADSVTNQHWRFYTNNGSGPSTDFVEPSTISIAQGVWHHIALVKSGNNFTFYRNGIQVGSALTSATAISATSDALTIGGAQNGTAYFNGYISNLRIVKGTAVYTSTFTPSTAPLTAIPGTVLLTLQDNRFKDNSVNNNTFTIGGTPKIQPFSPFYPSQKTIGTTVDYIGNSNYFPTNSDYLTLSMGDGQMFRTSDFTVEMWVYSTAVTHNILMSPAGTTGSWNLITYNSQLYWQQNGSNLLNVGSIVLNTWSHFAVCRVSGVLKVYINGVQLYSAANTYDYTNNSATKLISLPNAPAFYMSNFRVVNGTAVYTTSFFTPPTAPLTAIPGTVLLTCQDSIFKDNSVNALAITITGNPKISPVTPFTTTTSTSYDILDNGSMYLSDATADYMTLPSSSTAYNFAANVDFTFEAWVYPTEYLSGAWGIFDARVAGASAAAYIVALLVVSGTYRLNFYNAGNNTGSTIINLNTWTHVAVVRSGTFLRLYVNGVLDTSFSAYGGSISPGTTAPYIGTKDVALTGHGTSGYISNLRLVNGTALYLSSFAPSTVLRDVPGTVLLLKGNNAGIYDATGRNNLITLGDAKTSQVNKKYGNNSLYFDGTGDYIVDSTINNPLYVFPGDFTIEFWLYSAATPNYSVPLSFNGPLTSTLNLWGWVIYLVSNTSIAFYNYPGGNGNPDFNFAATGLSFANSWNHIAVVRSGTGTNNVKIFVNGSQAAAASSTLTIGYSNGAFSSNYLTIGQMNYNNRASAQTFNGYIDDLRIIKGTAKYTAAFTPPPRLGLVP